MTAGLAACYSINGDSNNQRTYGGSHELNNFSKGTETADFHQHDDYPGARHRTELYFKNELLA